MDIYMYEIYICERWMDMEYLPQGGAIIRAVRPIRAIILGCPRNKSLRYGYRKRRDEKIKIINHKSKIKK